MMAIPVRMYLSYRINTYFSSAICYSLSEIKKRKITQIDWLRDEGIFRVHCTYILYGTGMTPVDQRMIDRYRSSHQDDDD